MGAKDTDLAELAADPAASPASPEAEWRVAVDPASAAAN
eukprot:gene35413-52718_t